MNKPHICLTILAMTFAFLLSTSLLANAQQVGHVDYQVRRKVNVSITNSYGPITVKASEEKEVSVTCTSYAKSVAFDNQRHGNRISLVAVSDHLGENLAEYSVLVPGHAFLSLFARGLIQVEGLAGDVTIETASHPIEIKNLVGAYIHVKTLDGPVTLTAVRNSHVFVQSINGTINISNAPDSWVEANSTGGRITYDGDPGTSGNYLLSSHSGDVDVSIPASALAEIRTQSASGQSGQNPEETAPHTTRRNSLFLKSASISRAHFELSSFMGKVRLKRPQLH